MRGLMTEPMPRVECAIQYWDADKMANREKAELLCGSFGNVEVDERNSIPDESDDEEDLTLEVKHI